MGFDFEKSSAGDITRKAAADLRTHQYKFVKYDANGDVVLCTAAGEGTAGVLQNKPNTGEAARVRRWGPSKVKASAAINEGDAIATAADGRAKVAARLVQASGNGSQAQGRAMTDAGAADEIFTAFIQEMGVLPTADA